MNTPHFVSVAKALAMVASVASVGAAGCTQLSPREANAQTPTPRPPPAPACPSNLPVNSTTCAGHLSGQLCDFGYARCTCTAGATPSTPTWRCEYRPVPGPLPPPELAV